MRPAPCRSGRSPSRRPAAALLAVALLAGCGPAPRGEPLPIARAAAPATGPLVVLRANPRWFADAGGRHAVFLTGSHTWNTLQDWGATDPPPAFDFERYLDFLAAHGHDFVRLYSWEQAAWFPGTDRPVFIAPLPYLRTGPGLALDGRPRFDLARFDPAYFRRLRDRVRAAGARGVYVSVMLFDGWSVSSKGHASGNPWRGHPFERDNNVNGIDGDLDRDGQGNEVHTLANPAVTALQTRYLAKVVETVGDLDNVLYEISNESDPGAVAWEYEMIRTLRALEAAHGTVHPIGMTATYPPDAGGNDVLFASPADWISPRDDGRAPYEHDPPAPRAHDPVVLTDTDHLWGVGGRPEWVWKSFVRGLNPIFMDPYVTRLRDLLPYWPPGDSGTVARAAIAPEWEDVRTAMGLARAMADRVDLAAMRPAQELATSRYCLAAPGHEYLVYLPYRRGRIQRLAEALLGRLADGRVEVDLSAARGALDAEWLDTSGGRLYAAGRVPGGGRRAFRAPFAGPALLHLRMAADAASAGAPGASRGHAQDGATSGR